VALLSGAVSDTLVLNFAEQLLSDDAVSLDAVLIGAGGEVVGSQVDKLRAKGAERVQFRTRNVSDGIGAARECAAGADLVVLALSGAWGLDVDRSAESVRLLAELPASVIVLHAPGGSVAAAR